MAHYCVQEAGTEANPDLDEPVHIVISCLFKIRFNIIYLTFHKHSHDMKRLNKNNI
jgi:hypothetical protein